MSNMRSNPYPVPPSISWTITAIVTYGAVVLAGAIVLFVVFATDQSIQGWVVLGMWGVFTTIGGISCLVGVIWNRYRFEWMGCWSIVMGTAIYLLVTIIDTAQLGLDVLVVSSPTILFFVFGLGKALDRAIILSLIDLAARHRKVSARTGEIPEVPVDEY